MTGVQTCALPISKDDKVLTDEFNTMKESVVTKLSTLKESESDTLVKGKLQETIDRVSKENYSKLEYYKLKGLFENI